MESEVEVKFKLEPLEFERVRSFLVGVGSPSRVEEHFDVYFSRPEAFLEERFPFEWLSIRRRQARTVISYKHFFPEGSEVHTHCHEVEVEVVSAEAANDLLTSLGFVEAVTVRKVREEFSYKETHVGLDRVEDLGVFVEVEAAERKNLAKAHAAVLSIVTELALTSAVRDFRGYPYRLLELKARN